MKKGIHPEYNEIKVLMSDGTEFMTRSTVNTKDGVYRSEVDSKNHPFYTNAQRLNTKDGMIDKFNKRFAKNK